MLYCIHNSRINPLKLIWLFCLCESSWFGSRFDSRLKASPNSKEVFCLGESSLRAYQELPSDQTTFLSWDKQIVSSLCELSLASIKIYALTKRFIAFQTNKIFFAFVNNHDVKIKMLCFSAVQTHSLSSWWIIFTCLSRFPFRFKVLSHSRQYMLTL